MLALRCFMLGGFLFGVSAPASAVALLYTLTGSINNIDPDLAAEAPPFSVGDPFSLTVSIDSATVGSPLAADAMQYMPTLSVSLQLAPTWLMQGGNSAIFGHVLVSDSTRDDFQIWQQAFSGAAVPPDLGVFRPMQIIAQLMDSDGGSFDSLGLPTSLDITDFTFLRYVQIIYRDPNNLADQRSVFGTVTGVSVAVPEPGVGLLLVAGLLLVPRVRRTERR